jgi:hypothetical protein
MKRSVGYDSQDLDSTREHDKLCNHAFIVSVMCRKISLTGYLLLLHNFVVICDEIKRKAMSES